ncbi:transporter substrate-binding domain-containing protein [Pseudoalteromonas sp. SCSIO 43101]|uniref:transporter substrate-binding domain-containing protein n=1 Tax=Pseudoalteromonas sp. SCSIO 43101 TaxID=2822847 RepID=UPI00202B2A9C|nr:transporter substrate-binding domain-containing protein [Pseudoalteromonas sp. SCSIO 43101]URQ89290.1 transporter substrate-binding domain-containing protein [Pseudoalteromonas sp. SCSIO 43101]
MTAGQGKTWPDTKILKANQLPVVTTLKYPNLFPMLEGERFDYFPRGVNEPWDEIANHSELNLTVEPHLVIKYTAPLYFFVNKNNHTLHKQLNDALKEMIEDGTFNAMFLADSQVQMVLSKANLSSRRVIELDNPTLSSNTPNKNSPLWFNPFQ